jgi:hypothetical protein
MGLNLRAGHRVYRCFAVKISQNSDSLMEILESWLVREFSNGPCFSAATPLARIDMRFTIPPVFGTWNLLWH